MEQVNVTQLRQHLPSYLQRVARGERFQITLKGRVIARLEADLDESDQAWQRILSYRAHSFVGDVLSPTGAEWTGDSDNL